MAIVDTSAQGALGRLLRMPLRMLPRGKEVRILRGPLRGVRWILGSSPHGAWLGIGEREKFAAFGRAVKPGQVVYDLGANVGLYAIYAARLVGPQGRVVAFEPSPRNADFLRRHLYLNRIGNVDVHPVAVADAPGTAMFDVDDDPVAQRLSDKGTHAVAVRALDEMVAKEGLPRPHCLKIDVEGAELRVLHGARGLIADARPVIFIETHNRFVPRVHEDCAAFLAGLGYDVQVIGDTVNPTEIAAYPH